MVQTEKILIHKWCKLGAPGFVQVPLQLHRRLHLYVVLEEAAAERGLVVDLL